MIERKNLREWQKQAEDKIVALAKSGGKRTLIYACPGAGKTIAALFVARRLMGALPDCQSLIVVSSSLSIKTQWISSAKKVGIDLVELTDVRDLHAMQLPCMGARGYIVSYQRIGGMKESLDLFVQSTGAVVILDEVHHTAGPMGLRDGNKWGMAISFAFRKALFVLSTTGTPFREQAGNPIAFVDYNVDGEVTAGVTYTYENAIRDGVCRPIEFEMYDGQIEWRSRKSGRLMSHDFCDKLSKTKERERLAAAVSMGGQFPIRMLEAAHAKLTELRRGGGVDANAAGLVVAMDKEHAKAIAEALTAITGKSPVIVHSAIDAAQQLIDGFRESHAAWIIGIAMLSEGVDIPRLRVGVYMTNVRASLYFHQFCGRFTRVQQNKEERSFVFVPDDPEIRAIAIKIEQEKCHALGEDPQQGPAGAGRRRGPMSRSAVQVEDSDAEAVAQARSGFCVPVDTIRRYQNRINAIRAKDPSYHGRSDIEMLRDMVLFGAIDAAEVSP
jgi:superfamily II DNA or RNA helicase